MHAPVNLAVCPQTGTTFGTGWLPSPPDMRDFTADHPDIAAAAQALNIPAAGAPPPALPPMVDLRSTNKLSPVENQGNLGSCTANAAVGVVEYFENRAFGNFLDGARLFVYKNTRNLLGWKGDTGATLRATMAALAACGVPPEKYWPYTDKAPDFDQDPPAFVYSLGQDYSAVQYFNHDPFSAKLCGDAVLTSVKTYLAAGIPSMFGFYGFPSFDKGDIPGGIPYPCASEQAAWGHAIVAVGYDDAKVITNKACNTRTTGALLIRNSWGTAWGEAGYGWLPYGYVLNYLASDFWSLLSMRWINTGQFGL